ncbi:aminoglycoside phosphotransferase family protein [Pseudomonas sp. NPDC086581]|uniref:aminoglycoside phosphotransferase family protein n=1 Tax=Pseudomonas sp. NPDC086581 TaxID=3364432 RepID=UPI0038121AEE
MSQDARYQQMIGWLDLSLSAVFNAQGWGPVPEGSLTAASSDASFRRYFRWQGEGRSLIVMDAPPPQENVRPFIKVAGLLAEAGVHVPKILAEEVEQGFLLLDDLGRQTYLDVLTAQNAEELFEDALDALVAFQQVNVAERLPAYDEALLRRELQLFPEWYLQRHLGVTLEDEQLARWERTCDLLVQSALEQPRVFVHRDYMPRNLMLSEPNPGILDFQDAVHGPVTYDVTCLYKDAFLSWPEPRVHDGLSRYWRKAQAAGIPLPDSFESFLRASDLMGAQRHLKVIGIFARICHRDGKPRYLGDVPRFFRYLESVIARRPELADLAALLADLPKDETHPA